MGDAPLKDNLEQLLTEIVDLKLSTECYETMRMLAYKSPFERLLANLRTALWLVKIKTQPINALTDGLTRIERAALMEIDSAATSLVARETAHNLLDIDERIKLIRVITTNMSTVLRDRWERYRQVLRERPLDN